MPAEERELPVLNVFGAAAKEPPPAPMRLHARVEGWDLHASAPMQADARVAVERFCRYALRGPNFPARCSSDGRPPDGERARVCGVMSQRPTGSPAVVEVALFTALVLAAAVGSAGPCETVAACVVEAKKDPASFTPVLAVHLKRLPVKLVADAATSWEDETPALSERVREAAIRALGYKRGEDLGSREDALDLLAYRRAGGGDLSHTFITLAHSPYKDVLATCAGDDAVGRECALWAAKVGVESAAVDAAVWKQFLGDEPLLWIDEAVAGSKSLTGRLRDRIVKLLQKKEPLRRRDADALVAIDEPWAWEALGSQVRASPPLAKPVMTSLLTPQIGSGAPHRVHLDACFRALREPELGLEANALQTLESLGTSRRGGVSLLRDDERAELVRVAAANPAARESLGAHLVALANTDPTARSLALEVLFAKNWSWRAWSAAEAEPEATCWLTAAARDRIAKADPALVQNFVEWFDRRYETNLASEAHAATYGPARGGGRGYRCGTGAGDFARMQAADRAAFGLGDKTEERAREAADDPEAEAQPADEPVPKGSPDELRRKYEAELVARLTAALAKPPPPAGRVRCTTPKVSAAHLTLRPLEAGQRPTLVIASLAPHLGSPPVTLRAPDGTVVLDQKPGGGPLVSRFMNAAQRMPLLDTWSRGLGRYEITIGDALGRDERPSVTEFVLGPADAHVEIVAPPFREAPTIRPYRRAPAAVSLALGVARNAITITLLNRTADALEPVHETWGAALSFEHERGTWTPVALRAVDKAPSDPIAAGAVSAFRLTFGKAPVIPGRWRVRLTYAVPGIEGAAFVTDAIEATLAKPDGQLPVPAATVSVVTSSSGPLALRDGQIVRPGQPAKLLANPGVPLRGLLVTASGSVLAWGDILLESSDGVAFEPVVLPHDAPVVAAAMAGPEPVLFLASGEVVRRGTSWQRTKLPAGTTVASAAFVDAKRGFLLTVDGKLLETADGAQTWKPRAGAPAGLERLAAGSGVLYATSASGLHVLRAKAWKLTPANGCRDVAAAGPHAVAACDALLASFDGAAFAPLKIPKVPGVDWLRASIDDAGRWRAASTFGSASGTASSVSMDLEQSPRVHEPSTWLMAESFESVPVEDAGLQKVE